MTGGTPIYGNPHVKSLKSTLSRPPTVQPQTFDPAVETRRALIGLCSACLRGITVWRFSRVVSGIMRVLSHLLSEQQADDSSFSGCTFCVNILVPSPFTVCSKVLPLSQFHHRLESRATQHLPRKGCDKQGTKKPMQALFGSDSALSTVGVSGINWIKLVLLDTQCPPPSMKISEIFVVHCKHTLQTISGKSGGLSAGHWLSRRTCNGQLPSHQPVRWSFDQGHVSSIGGFKDAQQRLNYCRL